MLTLLSKLLFLKLPLNERMSNFGLTSSSGHSGFLVAAESSLVYYVIFGKGSFNENALPMLMLLIPTYTAYCAIHFMNDCEDFLKGKD